MNRQELVELFENTFPFWNKLSESDKETFIRSSQHVHFKKGTNIHDGNECTGVILIKSGSLRLYLLSEDGKEVTLYRLFPGDMCMLSASCVLENITFDVFVDSEENSECIVVGGCAYEDIARRIPDAKIFTLANCDLGDIRAKVVWYSLGVFTDNSRLVRPDRVKISQNCYIESRVCFV